MVSAVIIKSQLNTIKYRCDTFIHLRSMGGWPNTVFRLITLGRLGRLNTRNHRIVDRTEGRREH